MAVTIKDSDLGWMYFAPLKTKKVPPEHRQQLEDERYFMAQFEREQQLLEQTQPLRSKLRESDSKYVRLAKLGGRQDLLNFKDFPVHAAKKADSKAASYQRCEWFYQDPLPEVPSNSKAPQASSEPVAVLPNWFIHEHGSESGAEGETGPTKPQAVRQRVPFATEFDLARQREAAAAAAARKLNQKLKPQQHRQAKSPGQEERAPKARSPFVVRKMKASQHARENVFLASVSEEEVRRAVDERHRKMQPPEFGTGMAPAGTAFSVIATETGAAIASPQKQQHRQHSRMAKVTEYKAEFANKMT